MSELKNIEEPSNLDPDKNLLYRTESAYMQLIRYGGKVFNEEVLEILEDLSDLNEDISCDHSLQAFENHLDNIHKSLAKLHASFKLSKGVS